MQIEQKIANFLGLKESQLIFNFRQIDGITTFDLITINPNHQQSFLFHSLKAIDKNEALNVILIHIKSIV